MRKIAAFLLFIALASPVSAVDSFAQREADRSGASGTLHAIGNSIQGFFSSIGSAFNRTKSAK